MERILNYSILETLGETGTSLVYRVRKDNDEKTYVIKKLKKQGSSPVDTAHFRQEYEIIKSIDNDSVIRVFDCIDYDDGIILVLEDFDGVTLKSLLRSSPLAVRPFLVLSIKLAETVGHLHLKNIVHKDIKPNNILVRRDVFDLRYPLNGENKTGGYTDASCRSSPGEGGVLKLTDFGISQVVTHANEEIYNQRVIEGTLVYMSPEQTGRMNRSVDYRTDLYSLGITMYEMLTGTVPFRSKDPLEVIHSHIAQRPVSPHETDAAIPAVISSIIMKLLMKNAEERYQNAFGLMADLEECLGRYEKNGMIEPFELATRDNSIKFSIPQMFFGRESEIEAIIKTFERVSESGKCEMVLVTGNPGIGKSALVNEIKGPITARRGNFITGKFDRFRKDVPYSALLQAFSELTRQLLAENRDRIDAWKYALLKALGPNGKIITDIIPAVELIIDKQPDVPVLGPDESNNRFMMVFKNYIRFFASSDHPLVIFLDDLQSADLASLSLIRSMVADLHTRHMVFIGSYRNNEVDAVHPLKLTIEEIRNNGTAITELDLGPLGAGEVNLLIANFLRSDVSVTEPMAGLVHGKTNGNPFFINQFLKALYDEHILCLMTADELRRTAGNRGGWKWDIEKISAMRVTDNVVELMAGRIAKLSPNAQEVLKTAACVGNLFDIETLALIQNETIDAVLGELMIILQEGFIIHQGSAYSFYHDRIQEAAYSLIPPDRKAEMHKRIGGFLLRKTGDADLSNKLLYIVNQLNAGMSLIVTDDERIDLARLNLRAGIKAKYSAAYRSALNYIRTGIGLVNRCDAAESCWDRWYDLCLSLYSEAAEAAYICAEYNEMDDYADTVLANAKTTVDKAQVYEVQIRKFVAQNRLSDAIAAGLNALRLAGIRFPKKPTMLHLLVYLIKAKIMLIGKSMEDILNLPVMKDPDILFRMRLLNNCMSPVYWGRPDLIPFLVFKYLFLSLKHGNCSYAPYAYAGYGMLLCSIGRIEEGYAFGKMSQRLLDKLDVRDQKSRAGFVYNGFVLNWKEHIRETLRGFLEGYKASMETGDLEYAVYSLMMYFNYSYLMGKKISAHRDEIASHIEFAESVKQKTQLHVMKLYHQCMINLQSENGDGCMLKGPAYDEEIMVPQHREANDQTALITFHLHKMILCYMFHEYHAAHEHGAVCEKNREADVGQLDLVMIYFYNSLVYCALCESECPRTRKRHIRKAERNARQLKKWARHAPMNYLHKLDLVEAEIARVRREVARAEELYQKAIQGARTNEFLVDEAIACERAMLFYHDRGFDIIARAYLNKAYGAYERWGARAKLLDLEKGYPGLFITLKKEKSSSDTESSSGSTSSVLDISTVMKASLALSSEIDLEKLIKRIMTFSLQNAGAEKAFLILENEKTRELVVEAAGSTSSAIEVLGGRPLEETAGLSCAIVNYVHTTKEDVLLANAGEEGLFTNDEYIRQNKPKSILCTPFIHKGKISGILYLENNLTTNAFTPERIELLRILSSQTAISIENARLLLSQQHEAKIMTDLRIAAHIQNTELQLKTMELEDAKDFQISVFNSLSSLLIAVDMNGKVTQWNRAAERYTGIPGEEARGACMWELLPFLAGSRDGIEEIIALRQTSTLAVEHLINNEQRYLNMVVSPLKYKEGTGAVIRIDDVTEIRRKDDQLRQSQKMESIGNLAGGLAHDFNNILGGIIGATSLLRHELGGDMRTRDGLSEWLGIIEQSTGRARDLVQQLLSLSKKQDFTFVPVDLNGAVKHVMKICRNTFDKSVQITTESDYDNAKVKADPTQIEQVLLNLCINALHAMTSMRDSGEEQGGKLTISINRFYAEKYFCDVHADAVEGLYWVIRISDTGVGMEPGVMANIFDPFFTTKKQGTGLGLSMVYNIVKLHEGFVDVYSEKGVGTTFTIYLKVYEGPEEASGADEVTRTIPRGSGLMLVVDDEEAIRKIAQAILTEGGYDVITAADGREAVELFRENKDAIKAVILDMSMPGKSGKEAFIEMKHIDPKVDVLMASGFIHDSRIKESIELGARGFIPKPYSMMDLLTKIRELFP